MAVKADLVREHLVAGLVSDAERRYPGDPPEPLAAAMARALELVAGSEGAAAAPPETLKLAEALARLGYLGRLAETEMLEPARSPIEWLAERLEQAAGEGDSAAEAIVTVSRELALAEPEERPDPESGAPSWRIPGPGGHVRHYAALEAMSRRAPMDSGGNPRLGQGIRSPAELKRCWMLGFFLRCCDEAAPPPRA